jgi:hypothetical protein
MSSSESGASAVEAAERMARAGAERVYAELREKVAARESLAELSSGELQALCAVAAKEYARRQQEQEPFVVFGPSQQAAGLTATDAVVMAGAVLDALGVEIFELGMWRTWGGA